MKKTFDFGKIAYYSDRKINLVTVDVELRDTDKGPELSVCADIWNSKKTDIVCGGQCLDTLTEFLGENKQFMEIHNFWKKYHLNGMHAGTEKQEQVLEDYRAKQEAENPDTIHLHDYYSSCKVLEEAGCLVDNGYKYGTSWLYRAIPETDLNRIKELLS